MQRTNTTGLTTFNLPGPKAVTFTFLPLTRWMTVFAEIEAEGEKMISANTPGPPPPGRAIHISIPASSNWSMVHHWHPSQNGHIMSKVLAPPTTCTSVTCVEGRMGAGSVCIPHSSNATSCGPPVTVEFNVGTRVSWSKAVEGRGLPLTVDLIANQVMWRNVCSAVMDRGLFPRLQSTPWWFTILFYRCLNETRQKKLLDFMSALQLQCIYYVHDLHTGHGQLFPILNMWSMSFSRPPRWAWDLDWKGEQITAWLAMFVIRWICRLFLGMQGQYTEYSVAKVKKKRMGTWKRGGRSGLVNPRRRKQCSGGKCETNA